MVRLFLLPVYVLLFAIAVLSSCSSAPEVIELQDSILRKAKVIKSSGFKAELLQINLLNYHLSADSYGNLSTKNAEVKASLDLGKGFYTHDIHFFDNNKTILLFFEITDDAGLYNKAFCIDKTTLKTLWKTNLGHFKLSVGEAENDVIYLAAADNVYALNLNTGKVIWQTNGLYFKHGIYYIDKISVQVGSVKLSGRTQLQAIRERKIATIDIRNGNILSLKQ